MPSIDGEVLVSIIIRAPICGRVFAIAGASILPLVAGLLASEEIAGAVKV